MVPDPRGVSQVGDFTYNRSDYLKKGASPRAQESPNLLNVSLEASDLGESVTSQPFKRQRHQSSF